MTCILYILVMVSKPLHILWIEWESNVIGCWLSNKKLVKIYSWNVCMLGFTRVLIIGTNVLNYVYLFEIINLRCFLKHFWWYAKSYYKTIKKKPTSDLYEYQWLHKIITSLKWQDRAQATYYIFIGKTRFITTPIGKPCLLKAEDELVIGMAD